MTDPTTTSPTCAVCGQSCESKPFAKDAKGRVICRDCIDRKKAERATGAGGSDLMSGLLSKSKMAKATPCPNCKSYMPEGSVVCTSCGYNTQTAKAVTTRVYTAPKEKKSKAAKGPSFSFDPVMGAWMCAAVYALLAIGVFAMPPLLLVMYGLLALHGLVVSIWILVAMIKDGDLMWLLLSLIPVIGIFLFLYYMFSKTERTAMRLHWIISIGFTILMVLLATSFLPDEDALTLAQPVGSSLS